MLKRVVPSLDPLGTYACVYMHAFLLLASHKECSQISVNFCFRCFKSHLAHFPAQAQNNNNKKIRTEKSSLYFGKWN